VASPRGLETKLNVGAQLQTSPVISKTTSKFHVLVGAVVLTNFAVQEHDRHADMQHNSTLMSPSATCTGPTKVGVVDLEHFLAPVNVSNLTLSFATRGC